MVSRTPNFIWYSFSILLVLVKLALMVTALTSIGVLGFMISARMKLMSGIWGSVMRVPESYQHAAIRNQNQNKSIIPHTKPPNQPATPIIKTVFFDIRGKSKVNNLKMRGSWNSDLKREIPDFYVNHHAGRTMKCIHARMWRKPVFFLIFS